MSVIKWKSSGNSGDLISQLSSVRKAYTDSGKKALIYLRLNTEAKYYEGAPKHTVVDDGGKEVMLNERMYNMLRPLLLSQDYVEDVQVWCGQENDVDCDDIRIKYTGQPGFSISHWLPFLYHDLFPDISEKWIDIDAESGIKKRIVVNRTSRYHNQYASYFFLKKYGDAVVFAGTRGEYEDFKKEWGLDIEYLEVKDFLELAKEIKMSKVFLGNQSFCACLCEGAKLPRVIELCNYAPNVITVGKDAYGFLHQSACEYYIDLLFNR